MSVPELTQKDLGSDLFFIEPVIIENQTKFIVYFGRLISILPKCQYVDAYSSKYGREQNYIFKVCNCRNSYITKATTSLDSIFPSFNDAIFTREKDVLFTQSVVLHLKGEI